jgi:ABC-type nitrate/sulfonate/bicarbonate transport system substrate-binding protein
MRGSPLLISLVVRKDAPMKSAHDVKGKRVTGEYPAHLAVWYNMFGLLASAGLTWKDVRVIPVPAVNDGLDALVQGRADVSAFALGGAKVKEADAPRSASSTSRSTARRRARRGSGSPCPATIRAGSRRAPPPAWSRTRA